MEFCWMEGVDGAGADIRRELTGDIRRGRRRWNLGKKREVELLDELPEGKSREGRRQQEGTEWMELGNARGRRAAWRAFEEREGRGDA